MNNKLHIDMLGSFASTMIEGSLNRCSRWATRKIWTPHPYYGQLSFEKFPWQPEILNCREPYVTVQKAAQMGFSVAGLIKALFLVDSEKTDVLYILPTQNLASDFAKARLDQMVAISPPLEGLFIGANNVGLKKTVGQAHIFIRGSISEPGLVSVPVGCAIIDEYDRCNPKAMSLVLERMSAHETKHFFGLSTPTLPNFGINKQYLLGTQERFVFSCPCCSKQIFLDWEDSIEVCGDCATDEDCHLSFFKCKECGGKLPHETKSEWLSKARWEPTNKAYGHRSFHLNQMYGPAITPGELAIAYHRGQSDDASQVEFVNQKRGEPHLLEGAQVTDLLIDQCLGNYTSEEESPKDASRAIMMGVDVGTFLDVVVAEYLYDRDPGFEPHLNSIAKVLFAARFAGSDFSVLDMLMEQWQVQHCCIDFQPETNLAKAFCRHNHGYASVVQYRKGTSGHEIRVQLDADRVPVLTVDRTAFLDMALGRLHKGRIILPSNIHGTFREHVKNLARTYEKDEFGAPKAVYQTLGADHQAHALAYAEIAHMRAYSKSTGRNINPGESTRDL